MNLEKIKQEVKERGRRYYDVESTGLKVYPNKPGGPVSDKTIRPLSIAMLQEEEGVDCRTILDETATRPDHMIAAPGALATNGLKPSHFLGEQSQFSLAKAIHREFAKDLPIDHGYNNYNFDDQVLQHTFFENLMDPWPRARGNNVIIDVLKIVETVYCYAENAINFPNDPLNLRQESICKVNGIETGKAHTAMDDTIALMNLVRLLEQNAPEIYYSAIQCGSKKRILHRLKNELFFCYGTLTKSKQREKIRKVCIFICQNPIGAMNNEIWFFNLSQDPTPYLSKQASELVKVIKNYKNPVFFKLKANRPPILLDGADYCEQLDISSSEAILRAEQINGNQSFKTEFAKALEMIGNPWADKAADFPDYPEEEIFNGFASEPDKALINYFQEAECSDRLRVYQHLDDPRLKHFAKRLITIEHPNQCGQILKKDYAELCRFRLMSPSDAVPNLTLQGAMDMLDHKIAYGYDDELMINEINKYMRDLEIRVKGI